MKSYGDRVRWLVDHLARGNGRELARMAGLKNPGHVNTFLSRSDAKPSSKLDPDTIEQFVEHLSVDRRWLMSGEGEPFAGVPAVAKPHRVPTDDEVEYVRDVTGPGRWREYGRRYWAFRAQATVALAQGVPEAALDAAADRLGAHHGDGPTEEESRAAIAAYARQLTVPFDGREATAEDFETKKPARKPKAR